MSLPNLVIAGAPKCGTSSLFYWLADHPQACGSTVKETFYLMDEGHPLRRNEANYQTHGLGGYEKFFTNCSSEHRVVFEATTHYLYQKTAIEVLAKFQPQPQIVFVLRKPSARVYSSFQYSKHSLANVRGEVTFSRFIEEVNSQNGDAIREQARESAHVLTNDIQYSRYIEFLPEWFARFGRDRVHVFLFEDMRSDPRAFMKTLSQRVGIDDSFYDDYDFQARNETTSVRSPSLHRRVRKLNGSLPNGGAKKLLKTIYFTAQSRRQTNGISAEDKQTLHELDSYFRPFNQRLANETGLNLSSWD